MRTLTFGFCLALAVLLSAGCIFSSSDSDDDAGEALPPYPERTSPENVLEKLEWAYEHRDLDAYTDCLADSLFTFWLNPDDLWGDPSLPTCWGRETERTLHENMFAAESNVDSLSLTLVQYGDATEIPAPAPGDPSMWQYDENVVLWVYLNYPSGMRLLADCGATYIFRVDTDETGDEGETLWEIVEWYDLDGWHGRSHTEARREETSEECTWGSIKAMYR